MTAQIRRLGTDIITITIIWFFFFFRLLDSSTPSTPFSQNPTSNSTTPSSLTLPFSRPDFHLVKGGWDRHKTGVLLDGAGSRKVAKKAGGGGQTKQDTSHQWALFGTFLYFFHSSCVFFFLFSHTDNSLINWHSFVRSLTEYACLQAL